MPTRRHAPYLITEYLAIGPCRGAGGPSIDSLARLGFSHVIDLNADPSEKALSRKAGIRYYPIKTEDELSVDSWITNMKEAVSIITRAERRKEKVYLHCTFGVGRSPTIAMAYLVSKNWSAQAAIERVKAGARRVWNKGNPVTKYEGVLRAYADLIAEPPAGS